MDSSGKLIHTRRQHRVPGATWTGKTVSIPVGVVDRATTIPP